jgi:prevent-host-death family protein
MPAVSVRTLLRDASAVFESLEQDGEPILITRRGRPVAALVPVDPEQADAIILSAAPAMIESRRQAENARAEGRTTPLAEAMKRLDAIDAEQVAQTGDVATIDGEHRAVGAQAMGSPPNDLAELTYLLGAHHAAEVSEIAIQRADQITHKVLAQAAQAGLIERDEEREQLTERITRLNVRLFGLRLRHELFRDLLERIAAVNAGTTSLEQIAEPGEGILVPLAEAALGEASTFVDAVNADVIASSTQGTKLYPEIMEAALSVSIGALEKAE